MTAKSRSVAETYARYAALQSEKGLNSPTGKAHIPSHVGFLASRVGCTGKPATDEDANAPYVIPPNSQSATRVKS